MQDDRDSEEKKKATSTTACLLRSRALCAAESLVVSPLHFQRKTSPLIPGRSSTKLTGCSVRLACFQEGNQVKAIPSSSTTLVELCCERNIMTGGRSNGAASKAKYESQSREMPK